MSNDLDLFGQSVHPVTKTKRTFSTPAPIGSGPEGEMCKTCRYAWKRPGGAKSFYKCAWIKATGGPGTDIKLKWAACDRWRPEFKLLEYYLREIGHTDVIPIGLPPSGLILYRRFDPPLGTFQGDDCEAQAIAFLRANRP